jgi:hypothetical protein
MGKNEIETLINKKIRDHEIRVAWISGILGMSVILGIFHAIFLLKLIILTN